MGDEEVEEHSLWILSRSCGRKSSGQAFLKREKLKNTYISHFNSL